MAGRGASRGGGAAQAEGGVAAWGCGAIFSRTGQLWVYDSKPEGVGGGVTGSRGNMVKVYSVASSPVVSKNLAQRCVCDLCISETYTLHPKPYTLGLGPYP